MGASVGNNYAGRAKDFRYMIRQVFEALDQGRKGATEFAIVQQYVIDAQNDKDVRKDLLDRLYGKPQQAVLLGNDGDGPFRTIAWPLPKTTLDQ